LHKLGNIAYFNLKFYIMQNSAVFQATVLREASPKFKKNTSTGESIYVLHDCKITTEGPLKDFVIDGQRTLVNSKGQEKADVEIGQKVTLYMRIVENEKGRKPFFDISTAEPKSSDEDILNALAITSATVSAESII